MIENILKTAYSRGEEAYISKREIPAEYKMW
jgi:hypothetical protein